MSYFKGFRRKNKERRKRHINNMIAAKARKRLERNELEQSREPEMKHHHREIIIRDWYGETMTDESIFIMDQIEEQNINSYWFWQDGNCHGMMNWSEVTAWIRKAFPSIRRME